MELVHRRERGTEPERPGGKHEVLHGRIDRAATHRPATADRSDDEHGRLGHVVRQVLGGAVHAAGALVRGIGWAGSRVRLAPGVQVVLAELALRLVVADDDEVPRLRVAAARSPDRGVEDFPDVFIRHRIRLETAHRAQRAHGFEYVHTVPPDQCSRCGRANHSATSVGRPTASRRPCDRLGREKGRNTA